MKNDHALLIENGWYEHAPIRVFECKQRPIPIRVLLMSWCPSHLYH